jgi:hypothetical protein
MTGKRIFGLFTRSSKLVGNKFFHFLWNISSGVSNLGGRVSSFGRWRIGKLGEEPPTSSPKGQDRFKKNPDKGFLSGGFFKPS